DDGVALASLDGDGRDLLGDEVVGGGGALVRGGGDFVLFLARDREGGVVSLGGCSHRVVVEGIRQPGVGHVGGRGDAAVRPALAGAWEQVGGVRHRLLAPDGDDFGLAGADEAGPVDDGGEA